jgi:putative ABC transport system permease protein
LFDRRSRGEYGPIVSLFTNQAQVITELSAKQIKIKGLFSLGGSVFSANGLLITSDINYSQTLNKPLQKVNLGLVKVNEKQDINIIREKIAQKLPKGIKVIPLSEFMTIEKKYWNQSTPIGFIFNLLNWVGFIVGAIIVYQILFVQISDYLSVYATFKAIGYSNFYIIGTVFQEAIFMSIMGYIPATFFSIYLYDFIKNSTRMPLEMNYDSALYVLFLTCAMCLTASIIAIKKLQDADPADLFK